MAQQKRKAMLKGNAISDVPARRADGNAQSAASLLFIVAVFMLWRVIENKRRRDDVRLFIKGTLKENIKPG